MVSIGESLPYTLTTEGLCCVTVIIIGNELDELSLNPGWDCLPITLCQFSSESHKRSVLSSALNKL